MATTKKRRKATKRAAFPEVSGVKAEISITGTTIAECPITSRRKASDFVLGWLHKHGYPNATEDSDFENDIKVTPSARRAWCLELRGKVEALGCDPDGFGAEVCANAKTVRDIVDALSKALHVP